MINKTLLIISISASVISMSTIFFTVVYTDQVLQLDDPQNDLVFIATIPVMTIMFLAAGVLIICMASLILDYVYERQTEDQE